MFVALQADLNSYIVNEIILTLLKFGVDMPIDKVSPKANSYTFLVLILAPNKVANENPSSDSFVCRLVDGVEDSSFSAMVDLEPNSIDFTVVVVILNRPLNSCFIVIKTISDFLSPHTVD